MDKLQFVYTRDVIPIIPLAKWLANYCAPPKMAMLEGTMPYDEQARQGWEAWLRILAAEWRESE